MEGEKETEGGRGRGVRERERGGRAGKCDLVDSYHLYFIIATIKCKHSGRANLHMHFISIATFMVQCHCRISCHAPV